MDVKPILKSGGNYSYKSVWLITSNDGSMSGKYIMINFTNAKNSVLRLLTLS